MWVSPFFATRKQNASPWRAFANNLSDESLDRDAIETRCIVATLVPGVRRLWLPDFGDGRHDFPGHPDAFGRLVPRDVVGDYAEERRQCVRTAASARPEEI